MYGSEKISETSAKENKTAERKRIFFDPGIFGKGILVFLALMWGMTLICRYLTLPAIPAVEICRVEKNTIEGSGERYPQCLPLEAIHRDESGNTFVYCTEERESILGIALKAKITYVQIIRQDERWAAIREGTLTALDEVITYSSRPLENGTLIRKW